MKTKLVYIIASISCWLILALAMWIEYNYMLVPCPLCTLQRILFAISGALCVILLLYDKIIFQLGLLLSSLLGATIAGRQVWLQSFPADIPHSCSAGLLQLIHKYPLLDFIKVIFINSSSECSHIDYTITGLSLAAWSLMIFIILSIISLSVIIRKKKVDF